MEPESKFEESNIRELKDASACQLSRHPACASVKRTTLIKEIDPAIKDRFCGDFNTLPLVEVKIHDYIYMKHCSLETNELLKCRWKAFKDCLEFRVRVPFRFPTIDDMHFYNYQTRYLPSESITAKDHRLRVTRNQKLDVRSHDFVPNELHFKTMNYIELIEKCDDNSAVKSEKHKNENHNPGENVNDNIMKDSKKLMQHRGVAPFLRRNSLKLISNSTLCVFRWSKSQYRCFCCKSPFSDIDLLRNHTKSHTLEEIEKSIIFQQNKHIKVEISHLSCDICTRKLNNLKELSEHLKNHGIIIKDHLLIPFKIENELKCQFCFKIFSKFSLLNVHMHKYYQTCVCHLCGLSFCNSKYLTQHKLRKHKPIICKLCGVNFKTPAEKNFHENKTHGLERKNIARYPCQYCNERFYQENSRILHLVEKHGEKRPEFSCDLCNKVYISRSLLNAHVKTSHLKEKVHQCEICTKSFYSNSDLSRHRITHSGKKNFTCTSCNNLFASKDTLRRHMKRTHSVY